MKRVVLLSALLMIGFSLIAISQNRYSVEITPLGNSVNPVIVTLGTPVQFTAHVYEYTSAGTKVPVQFNALQWTVDPASLGTITSSGEFRLMPANSSANSGRVIASVAMAGLALQGSSYIATGQTNTGPYTFTGMVTDASNLPVQNAKVSVMSTGTTTFMVDGFTNAQGIFSIHVPVGTYAVRAEAAGYLPEFFDNVATITLATTFTTDPAKLVYDNINFVLGSGGSISGTVTDAATNAPLPGINVALDYPSNTRPPIPFNWVVVTDHNGNYRISGIPDGQYHVSAHGQDYVLEYYNDQKDRTNANPVAVAQAAQVTGIDFALDQRQKDPVYTISGTVVTASTVSMANATVFAQMGNSGPNQPTMTSRTDNHGNYTMTVPAGTWILWASSPGYVTEWFDNAVSATTATPVTVDANTPDRTGIDFSLGTGGAIEGYVLDAATNLPIQGANVSVPGQSSTNPAGVIGGHAVTDHNGFYRITGLATGDYTVVAHANGFMAQYFDMVADVTLATKVGVTDGQTTSNIDFALGVMPGISGNVTNETTGLPIQGAHVLLDGPNVRAVALTDVHGNYHLATTPGTYKVRAEAQGYAAEWYDEQSDPLLADNVVVPQVGDATGIDFTLTRHGGSIAGVVLDANAQPIAGADVSVWINAPAQTNVGVIGYGKAVSAADGSYLIDGLPAGSYIARAHAAGFIPEHYDNAATFQAATVIPLAANQAVTGIDFSLEHGGTITGTVTDAATAAPIPHAYVHARSTQRNVEIGARTDAQGNYRLEGLPSGNYTVFFAAQMYIGEFYDDVQDPALATIVTVSAPATLSDIDAALVRAPVGPRNYRGTVTTGNQAMSSFILVEAINPLNGLSIVTTTDSRNGFDFDAWDNAIVRVRAIGHVGAYAGNTHNWKESQWNGFSGGMSFVLEPVAETGFAEVTGTVTDAGSGAPLANAWVYGIDASGATWFAVTGRNGGFLMPNANNGELDIMVSEPRYEPTNGTAGISEARGSADIAAQRSGVTSVSPVKAVPLQLSLEQNYPNPFNPSTTIAFTIPRDAKVKLRVFNLLGKEIATLIDGSMKAGSHTKTWNAASLPSGVYFYRLETGGTILTRRMALSK